MFRSCIIVALMLIWSVAVEAKTILLIGDSLSAGYGLANLDDSWPALLQKRLAAQYPDDQLINDSTSGDTTSNGLSKLPDLLNRYRPDIVMIEYGGNDGLRGLSLEAMQKNLAEMIERAQMKHAEVLLIGVRLPPNYGKQYTEDFYNTYIKLSKKYRTVLVKHMLENVGGHADLMQPDGLHPNEKAQPVVLENVWIALEPLLKASTLSFAPLPQTGEGNNN